MTARKLTWINDRLYDADTSELLAEVEQHPDGLVHYGLRRFSNMAAAKRAAEADHSGGTS